MSRIGNAPVTIPEGVEVKLDGNHLTVKGPKGTLERDIHKNITVTIEDNLVKVMRVNGVDYISLTDLASYINPNDPSGVIRNWMSTRNSFSFYSLWEELNNPDFNSVKSHGIKIDEVPYNRFTMTPICSS